MAKLLRNYSVVLTTYGTLLNELADDDESRPKSEGLLCDFIDERLGEESGKGRKNKNKRKSDGPLFQVEWFRYYLHSTFSI